MPADTLSPGYLSLLRETWDRRWLGGLYEAAPPLEEVRVFVEHHLGDLQPGDAVIDLGCGNGRHLRALAGTATIVGTDISGRGLGSLCRTLELEGRTPRAVQCLHAALPFRHHCFAAALAVQALEDGPVASAWVALRELHQILRPGAPVFVRVPARRFEHHWRHDRTDELGTIRYLDGPKAGIYVHFYEAEELSDVLRSAGFELAEAPWATDAPRIPPLVGRAPFWNAVAEAVGLHTVSGDRAAGRVAPA